MQIQEVSNAILSKMPEVSKWQQDFLNSLFYSHYTTQGRLNIANLARYSPYHESTFYRNYEKDLDFTSFNALGIAQVDHEDREWIAAADCSFINKSGKHTYGRDSFWSGLEGREKKGLEISLVSLIDVHSSEAFSLDVVQTPAKLAKEEGGDQSYTRIDFYRDQFQRSIPFLREKRVRYGVFDGYYTKKKMFDLFDQYEDLDMIGKLRSDADLRYLYDEAERGPALTHRTYDGKVRYDDSTNGWRRWKNEGVTEEGILVLSRTLNSPHFKRNLKVAACINTKTKKYILLFSTDLDLSGRQILKYYRKRFQIEFLFRDAKQFTGLLHCQCRKKERLHFHFNVSLSAVNLARIEMQLYQTVQSMNDYKRLAYNKKIINLFMSNLDINPELEVCRQARSKSITYGLLRA